MLRPIVHSGIQDGQGRHSAHHSGFDQTGALEIGPENRVRLVLVQTPYLYQVLCPPGNRTGIIKGTRQACVSDPLEKPIRGRRRTVMEGSAAVTSDALILSLRYRARNGEQRTTVRCVRSQTGLPDVELDCSIDGAWPNLSLMGSATLRFGAETRPNGDLPQSRQAAVLR